MKLKPEILENIPYLDIKNLKGRFAYLGPFLNDNSEWDFWFPSPDGKSMIKLKIHGLVQSTYFAKTAANENDVYFHFYDLFSQHLNFEEVKVPLGGLLNDIFNLGATLQKIELFAGLDSRFSKNEIARFVSTELEYYFLLLRSIFDIFQEIITKSFHNIKSTKTYQKFKPMPETFSKMVIKNNRVISKAEFSTKYDLPEVIRDLYLKYSIIFKEIRDFRDLIAHRGVSPDHIYLNEKGFLVRADCSPYKNLSIWSKNEITDTGLAPLNNALAFFTNHTLLLFEDFAEILKKHIKLLPPTVPGYKVFIYSDSNQGIQNILKLLDMKKFSL
jgi:hypothetical protein